MIRTNPLRRPRLLQLLLAQVSQLVDRRRLPRDNTLNQLNRTAKLRSTRRRILDSLRLDLDQSDSRVVRPSVMLAIAPITVRGLDRRRVVLVNQFPVGLDGCIARDGSPLARVVEEAKVDFAVALDVVRLAGLGVGVEDQVDAVALL